MSLGVTSPSKDLTKSLTDVRNCSNLIIEKPKFLEEKCPIETVTERLPVIDAKIPKRKKCNKTKESTSEPVQFLTKSGVSLPKLEPKKLSKPAVGEPLDGLHTIDAPSLNNKSLDFNQDARCFLSNSSVKLPQDAPKLNIGPFLNCSQVSGPSKCHIAFDMAPNLNNENVEISEEKLEPSHALKQWELWMTRRKHMQDILSKQVGRRPCDLVINQADTYRKVREDKTVFSYTQIPKSDKWRGHPYRWKSPERLSNKNRSSDPSDEDRLEYFLTKTKMEEGIVPEMEFIDVPFAIQKEKGLVDADFPNPVNSMPKFWKESLYRKERCRYFQKQRKKMKPHEIEMDELAVIGQKIPRQIEEVSSVSSAYADLPKIQVTEVEEENQTSCFEKESIACLVIGDKEVKYKLEMDVLQKDDEYHTWELDFGLNKVGTLVEQIINVENRGTMAVSYEWVSKKPDRTRKIKPQEKSQEPYFFFDKNPGIFLPGQKYQLKFYHRTRKPGIRKETWHLNTSPLFKSLINNKIILSAVAVTEYEDSEVRSLDSYLKRQVGRTIVRTLLNQIAYHIEHLSENVCQFEYNGLFTEKHLFEYYNRKHYYHSEIVKELKKLFHQIPLNPQEEWDLCLDSLAKLVTAYAPGKVQYLLLHKISQYAKMLLRPNYVPKKKYKVHKMVYQILCKMANFMEEDFVYLKHCLSEKTETRVVEGEEFEESMSVKNLTIKPEDEVKSASFENLCIISSLNLMYFQRMIYLKVYHRLCEAVECVAGIVELNKFFKPLKEAHGYTPYDE